MRKILLEKNKSKKGLNIVNCIPIEFNRNTSLFHNEIMSDTVNTMQVYNDEKDSSTKYRLIFTLCPICTNILFNRITEVVYKEGDNSAYSLQDNNEFTLSSPVISESKINRKQVIRNTEYSRPEHEFTYHCGYDIFNNHLLRSKESITVGPKESSTNSGRKYILIANGETDKSDSFNTIGDYNVTHEGEFIKTIWPNSTTEIYTGYKKKVNMPLYVPDTLKPISEAFFDNIKRKNGWLGFYNKTTIKSNVQIVQNNNGQNKKVPYNINRVLNNFEHCSFISLCPEPDLFYFTPKKNLYRNRLEHNWNYFITYPYKSKYNGYGILSGKGQGLPIHKITDKEFDGLSEINSDQNYIEYNTNNGISLALFVSPVKHNLQSGDYVYIKMYKEDENNQDNKTFLNIKCNVVTTGTPNGNYKDYCFSVRKNDFDDYSTIISVDDDGKEIKKEEYKPKRYAKVVNGFECDYYFRIFKNISNSDKNLNYSINKLSFANTIYGDEVSQLIFDDEINIEGLKDNQGRPLTEIYLTIIKTNKGYKKWYEDKKYNDLDIEYSHVFGEVTAGFDLPKFTINRKLENNDSSEKSLYPTIRGQHNIGINKIELSNNEVILIPPSTDKIDINLNKGDSKSYIFEFMGDLVEFNPTNLNETILEDVSHRFNTAQREHYAKTDDETKLNTIYYDEMLYTYSDVIYSYKEGEDNGYSLNNPKDNDELYTQSIYERKLNEGYANIAPEGYIYKPHHKIQIGRFNDLMNESYDTFMEIKELTFRYETIKEDGVTKKEMNITFNTNIDYSLMNGDIISIMNKNNKQLYKFRVKSYNTKTIDGIKIFICEAVSLLDNIEWDLTSISTESGENVTVEPEEKATIESKNNDEIVPEIICSDEYYCFKHNLFIPDYAYLIPDNSGVCIWRDIVKPSSYTFDDELSKIPFTNGAFYHHKNINFFVKRQDPFGEYEQVLFNEKGEIIKNEFDIVTDKLDISAMVESLPSNTENVCFF